jgi:outer membrane protein assembly factor BamB
VDFDGAVKWVVNFGRPNSRYGLASSLAFHRNTVIYQLDQGQEASENLSAILGIDAKSGGVVWRTFERPVPNSWSSPVVVDAGGRKIVVACGDPWVIAYDPETGGELWRLEALSDDVAASPVAADGLVYVTNMNAKATAIRPPGEGEDQPTVVWTFDDGLPDTTSPVATSKFFLQTVGTTLTCLDAKTGKLFWQNDLGDTFVASPTVVGDRVYLFGIAGKGYVFDLAETFGAAQESDLGEPVDASPAFGDGFIYVRGEKNLYCIGRKPAASEGAK